MPHSWGVAHSFSLGTSTGQNGEVNTHIMHLVTYYNSPLNSELKITKRAQHSKLIEQTVGFFGEWIFLFFFHFFQEI